MKRLEKPLFVDNLTEEFKGATSFVVINYEGLTVKLQQELKKRLKVTNAKMLVAKNSLIKRAGKKAKLPAETLADTVLQGPTALIISASDPIAPLQVLAKFAQEHEIPQFKAGLIEGKFQDKDSLKILSTLPSKDVLLAQIVGAVASPLYSLVSTAQGNLQKLLYILKSKGGELNG